MASWAGILLVLTLLALIFGGLRFAQRRHDLDPEVTRKGAHILMGGVTLSFPWLFASFWPVAVLGGVAVAAFLPLRIVPALRDSLGTVLHRVGRRSFGELYYAVAVVVLFFLSGGDPILYGVPILLLGLADPVAALVGLRYGQSAYQTSEGFKTGEGSAGFFLVAFFCTHVPVLFFTDTGRFETLLIALIAAFLLMLLEAISWRGLDNLFVPLGGYALLSTHLAMDAYELVARLVVITALFALATIWHRETTLDRSATFAASLVGVVTWMIGGWTWILAPAALYFGYTLLWPASARRTAPDDGLPTLHTVQNVLGVASVGFGWLVLSVAVPEHSFLYPYTLAYASTLALIGAERFHSYPENFSRPRILGRSTARSCTALIAPIVIAEGIGTHLLPLVTGLVATVLISVLGYTQWRPVFDGAQTEFRTHVRRAVLVTGASALGLPFQFLTQWMSPANVGPILY